MKLKQLFFDFWGLGEETIAPEADAPISIDTETVKPSATGQEEIVEEIPEEEKESVLSAIEPIFMSGRDAALEALCAAKLAVIGAAGLRVKVIWSNRLKTTAGVAHWKKSTITLNSALQKIAPEQIERTLLHELAHLLAQYRAGNQRIYPHGMKWHTACVDLGIPDETRCHTLPFEQRRQTRRYLYKCPQCHDTVARVRPFRGRAACYACCRRLNGGRYDERFRLVSV